MFTSKCKLKQNVSNLFSNSFFWKLTAKLVRSVRQLAAKCAHAWRPSLVFLQFHICICLDFLCIFTFSFLPPLVSISPRHGDQWWQHVWRPLFSAIRLYFFNFAFLFVVTFCVFVQKARWLHVYDLASNV